MKKFTKLITLILTAAVTAGIAFAQPKLVSATAKTEYAIDWYLNGGVQNESNTATYTAEDGLVLSKPTREGYEFTGWFDNARFTGLPITEIKKGDTQKKYFWAGWKFTTDGAKTWVDSEMVNVIPQGMKAPMENFAGVEGTTIINAYDIGKHEVTQNVYASVMGYNPSNFYNNPADGETQDLRPVENVSWYDAIVFCNRLSVIMGKTPCYSVNGTTDTVKWGYKPHDGDRINYTVVCDMSANGYRLPTSGEWEMAARGGTVGGWDFNYSGSDNQYDVGWTSYTSNDRTHQVGIKEANALGLYDMTGNVYEWCNDAYDSNDSSDQFIQRGGCFESYNDSCAVTYRSRDYRQRRSEGIGFRIVCSCQ